MKQEKDAFNSRNLEAANYFLSLKTKYEEQRQPYEPKWDQAQAAVYMQNDKLDKVYNSEDGRANINSPIMKWKVKGIISRINRIIFGADPIGRIEEKKISKDTSKNVVDLWNKYIFENQLAKIDFKENYKLFTKNKTIFGTAIAKIPQEYETKEVDFFDDEEPQEFVVKDDTYFKPILLTEFYSDVSKYDINESQACIHSTTMSLVEMRKNEKRRITETFDVIDRETGEVVGQEDKSREVGYYENLDLLQDGGKNLTQEQEDYLNLLDFNVTATQELKQEFQKQLKDAQKTGFIAVDECYGRYVLDGEEKEVICTIANGAIIIRLEETPFKHRKYIRPFIVGRYEPIPNCLYGDSNVMAGMNLLYELNASRAQAIDAKTRSILNMWYEDKSHNVKWDGTWRANGVIKGTGQNGLVPLLNPYIGNITNDSTAIIQRDMDQLWSLSPVQEGASNSSQIPSTARGTLAVIQQNDMPLNDIIDHAIDEEIKPFIEMIYERNLVFKSVEDLLEVWTEEEMQKAGITKDMDMKELFLEFNTKILGNLELSNELAHQNGYVQFLNFAQTIPPIASRLDWKVVADKMLRSFGIKDDATEIFLDEEIVAQVQQEQQQANAQSEQAAKQEAMQIEQMNRDGEKEDYSHKKYVDTESKIVEMQAEATLEKATGQKVQ